MSYPYSLRHLSASIALCAIALAPVAVLAASKPIPKNDPSASKVWRLEPGLKGEHPRILVTKSEVEELRRFYKSPEAKPWRDALESYLGASMKAPTDRKFLTDATDGQRQGLWRLPTVSLHYLLTGDNESLKSMKDYLETFDKLNNWETGDELDSGMSAANIMIGAAIAYDWAYNDLDPAFREEFGKKLFEHARRVYYGGHLNYNGATAYWQNDPANNHRWHRNAGMTLAMLAVYEEEPDQQWMMDKTMDDLAYVAKWLPDDGSSHEGPNYFTFGGNHLTLAFEAADIALGSHFMEAEYFKQIGLYRIHSLLPGMQGIFSYGDGSKGSVGGYNNFVLAGAAHNQQPDIMDGLRRLSQKKDRSFEFGWFSLIWDDPKLASGNMDNLHTKALFPDVGFAVMRDSWKDTAIAASFICGPFGGYDLMKFSNGGKSYVNVAHDDPDANEFLIAKGPSLVVETDGYSKHKASKNHNTILINGLGQMTTGRDEGEVWSQPARSGDMTKMAYITGFKDADKIVAVEGEAAGSYLEYSKGSKSRPDLDSFRRTFLWVEGSYILVLDDIRAPKDVDISWLIQSQEIDQRSKTDNRFDLKSDKETIPMQIVSDAPFTTKIGASSADNRGEVLGLKQLSAEISTKHARFASVYDPWGSNLTVAIIAQDENLTWVQVKGSGFEDVWKWEAARKSDEVSTITATRKSGPMEGFPFVLDNSSNAIMWKKR